MPEKDTYRRFAESIVVSGRYVRTAGVASVRSRESEFNGVRSRGREVREIGVVTTEYLDSRKSGSGSGSNVRGRKFRGFRGPGVGVGVAKNRGSEVGVAAVGVFGVGVRTAGVRLVFLI